MDDNRLNEKDKSGFFSKLCRILYIGNLDENINDAKLYKYFGEFGDIISINIKKEDYVSDGSLKVCAMIKYFDTSSVVLALHKMNGVDIEGSRVRLGFGKSHPSRCVWITGVKQSCDDNFLLIYLADCGPITTFSIDHTNKRALVYFKEIENAEAAINKMKDGFINGLYFHGDYASSECQIKFAEFFNKQNHKNCSSIRLDNVNGQSPSIRLDNVNGQSPSIRLDNVNGQSSSIHLDNVNGQGPSLSNFNEQKSAGSHYVEEDNPCIANKKSTSPITCTLIKGIADSVTTEYLESRFSQFGPIKKCLIDRPNKCGVLCFQEELHAQSAVTVMDGSYIEGELLYVRLASFKCRDCEVSNTNNDNLTIQQQDNSTSSSPYCAWHMDPSCRCSINDGIDPINFSDQFNNSINVNNAQNVALHKYLNINNNIPDYSPSTNHVYDSPIKIIFNEYPPQGLIYPTRRANFNVMSLPLPAFAKNISKQLTSTSLINSKTKNIEKNKD
ncbi:protein split ends-like [Myzus persicae]|uniref:protein split ends-like n=1 Tax=Myzus persicae TaxID=13164 RepID=UPI000B9362B5|nr:protein split ends-like [Myzus persicae]